MASTNQHFNRLIEAGNPVGEIIAVERFMVEVNGLQPCQLHSIVMFDDGTKGFVHEIKSDRVIVLHLGTTSLSTGMVAVLQNQELVTKVGKNYIGRVVSVTGEPLDGKGPIAADGVWPVFNPSPPIYLRQLLDTQVESGVMAIDALLPLVRGQRMALLGDSKSGKSTLAAQMTINQKNTDQLVVYCLIAKRRSDIDTLLTRLNENKAMDHVIVVVSTMFESLILSYLAPYVACSMAEYLWQSCNLDTMIIYDDLTAHAHAYREISLLSGVSPGRDSYPGDMFYAHSSLLERAGRLASSGRALTAIPIVHVANGDITAYLPTNVMSITDGQWILDMDIFRSGFRPSLSFGLSVTRAGGVGHSDRQKAQAALALKILADYRQAQEFSHFGSELSDQSKRALEKGKLIHQVLTQSPGVTYSLAAQQLLLDVIINLEDGEKIDLDKAKLNVNHYAEKLTGENNFDIVRDDLKALCLTHSAHPVPRPPINPALAVSAAAKPLTQQPDIKPPTAAVKSEPSKIPVPKGDKK
ncbi:MAG: sodium-transporting two-sector ATPase [Candidatus Saccharimonadales bacterium]